MAMTILKNQDAELAQPHGGLLDAIAIFLDAYNLTASSKAFKKERKGIAPPGKTAPTILEQSYKHWHVEMPAVVKITPTKTLIEKHQPPVASKTDSSDSEESSSEDSENSSNDSSSDSSSEEESEESSEDESSDAEMVDAPQAKLSSKASKVAPSIHETVAATKKVSAKRKAPPSSSSDSDSDDSSNESSSDDQGEPAKKRFKIAPTQSSQPDVVSESDSDAETSESDASSSASDSDSGSSSDSDSNSDSSSDDSSTHSKAKKVPLPESESDTSDSDSESESQSTKGKPPRKAASPETSGTLTGSSESNDDSESDSSSDASSRKVSRSKSAAKKGASTVQTTVTETIRVTSSNVADPPLPPMPKMTPGRKTNAPFSRIPKDIKVDDRLASNAFVPYDYAQKAHEDLIVTRGKGFTKEKNKKKRGSYKGGFIDVHGKKGIKFDD